MNVMITRLSNTRVSTATALSTCPDEHGKRIMRYMLGFPLLMTLVFSLVCSFFEVPAFGASGCDGAGNCYVRSGATGSGSGADWTNAYTALPSGLTRGITYYVAGGNYTSGHNFNDPDSGTVPIIVQAATIAAHGTSSGWNNSYQAQAVFTCCWTFSTDYYTINGAYRSTATGNPTTDWTTGYGFKLDNQAVHHDSAAIGAGSSGGSNWVHDVTVEYMEVNGSHITDSSIADDGIDFQDGSYNIKILYNYVHNVGDNLLTLEGNHAHQGGGGGYGPGNNFFVEFNYLSYDCCSTSGNHGQACQCSEGLQNLVYANNITANIVSTASIATATASDYNNGNGANGPWYIFGNTFYTSDPSYCAAGDGIMLIFDASFCTITSGSSCAGKPNGGDVYFVNNTIANMGNPPCTGTINTGITWGGGYTTPMRNYISENNIWWKTDCPGCGAGDQALANVTPTGTTSANGATFLSVTWDYNAWFQSQYSAANDSSPNVQKGSSTNPFTASGSYTYFLASDTAPGTNTHNAMVAAGCTDALGNTCNDYDPMGVARAADGTWDRGAFQIAGTASPPAPPTNLTATPH